MTPPTQVPFWKLFLEKFKDPIIRILLVAAALSLIISILHNEYAETIGIIAAILLATGVGFWFEMDANKKFKLLNQVNDDILVKVIRDGNIQEVPKKDIVVGDIVAPTLCFLPAAIFHQCRRLKISTRFLQTHSGNL